MSAKPERNTPSTPVSFNSCLVQFLRVKEARVFARLPTVDLGGNCCRCCVRNTSPKYVRIDFPFDIVLTTSRRVGRPPPTFCSVALRNSSTPKVANSQAFTASLGPWTKKDSALQRAPNFGQTRILDFSEMKLQQPPWRDAMQHIHDGI